MAANIAGQRLGRIGVWSIQFRFADPTFIAEAAAEVEELGYGAIWFPGGRGGDLDAAFRTILEATNEVVVASGILNIWMHEPEEVGQWWHAYSDAQKARVMLGLGVGHADAIGNAWKKPLSKMTAYLDGLDAVGVPHESRCIAALAPKMLGLAATRSAGSHPYLVPPEHSAIARETMGPDALLAPEQGVILDSDPASARAKAREQLEAYVGRENYCNSWRRLGFTDDDIATRSDRLVDAIFAWGTPEQIGERLKAHLDAGADHVCLQVISGGPGTNDPAELRRSWRDLAPIAAGL
ncbi:MAG: TIGR03620 family F420-dependent LLM class oxidoreductase [Novosphingobium sp.]|nr:TIGR03620 family F420-dependent LLM class oxidoreductase [Novosphingobium sp.]